MLSRSIQKSTRTVRKAPDRNAGAYALGTIRAEMADMKKYGLFYKSITVFGLPFLIMRGESFFDVLVKVAARMNTGFNVGAAAIDLKKEECPTPKCVDEDEGSLLLHLFCGDDGLVSICTRCGGVVQFDPVIRRSAYPLLIPRTLPPKSKPSRRRPKMGPGAESVSTHQVATATL